MPQDFSIATDSQDLCKAATLTDTSGTGALPGIQ